MFYNKRRNHEPESIFTLWQNTASFPTMIFVISVGIYTRVKPWIVYIFFFSLLGWKGKEHIRESPRLAVIQEGNSGTNSLQTRAGLAQPRKAPLSSRISAVRQRWRAPNFWVVLSICGGINKWIQIIRLPRDYKVIGGILACQAPDCSS